MSHRKVTNILFFNHNVIFFINYKSVIFLFHLSKVVLSSSWDSQPRYRLQFRCFVNQGWFFLPFVIHNLTIGLFYFNWDKLHARLNSPYKAWSYKKKKHKKIKARSKSVQKEPTAKRCLFILDFKLFRSQVKGKHSKGREFQSLAMRGQKTVNIDILATSRNDDRIFMQSIRITSRLHSRKRKWNQLSQFR